MPEFNYTLYGFVRRAQGLFGGLCFFQEYAKVFKTEEKGSDVNIALHVLNDAWLDRYDIAIIVSNDSDLLEAIQLVKKHHKEKKVGVALPLLNENRNPSRVLTNNADFVKHIRRHVLESSQLPNPIPGTSLYQPESWRSILA